MNDTIFKRIHTILQLSSVGAAGIAMVLQTVAFLFNMSENSNYYEIGAAFPIAATALAILAAIIGTFDAFFSARQVSDKQKERSLATIPCGCGFIIAGVFTTGIGTIGMILLVLSAIYCLLSSFTPAQYKFLSAGLGLVTIPAFIYLTGCLYFDNTIEMNAPAKLLLQIAFLSSMLFFTGELRYQMGIPAPRVYRMVCAWTIASGAVASLPVILAYLFGTITRTDYLTGAILLLGVTATAIIRLFSYENKTPLEATNDADTTI